MSSPHGRRSAALPSRSALVRQPTVACRAQAVATQAGRPAPPREQVMTSDPANNVTEYIYSKMGANLHMQPDHPMGIIKTAIYNYLESQQPGKFKQLDDYMPIVSTK